MVWANVRSLSVVDIKCQDYIVCSKSMVKYYFCFCGLSCLHKQELLVLSKTLSVAATWDALRLHSLVVHWRMN